MDTPGRMLNTPNRMNRWDMTPVGYENKTPKVGETPTPGRAGLSQETPYGKYGETPTPRRLLKSKWDDKTPMGTPGMGMMTPGQGMTPGMTNMTPERLK